MSKGKQSKYFSKYQVLRQKLLEVWKVCELKTFWFSLLNLEVS